MNRYKMELIVEIPEGPDRGEKCLRCNVTAASEHDARRAVLIRAYGEGQTVRRFLSVKKGTKL